MRIDPARLVLVKLPQLKTVTCRWEFEPRGRGRVRKALPPSGKVAKGARPIRIHVAAKPVRPLLTSHDDPTPVSECQEIGWQRHRPNHRCDGNEHEPPGIGKRPHVLPTRIKFALSFGAEAEPQLRLPAPHGPCIQCAEIVRGATRALREQQADMFGLSVPQTRSMICVWRTS